MTLALEHRLDDIEERLSKGLSQWIVQREHRWALAAQALKGPVQEIILYEQQLVRWCEGLRRMMMEKIQTLGALMTSYERLLPQLSYQQTLERGFALVFDKNEKICSSVTMAQPHQDLVLRFHDGKVPVSITGPAFLIPA
jgi:exonuclease VII large subunit